MTTISRFNGMIQTDGSFYFLWANLKSATFQPKVILTQVGEKDGILMEFQKLLRTRDISSSISNNNLTVERHDNVKKLLSFMCEVSYLNNPTNKNTSTSASQDNFPLVGSKLRDFLILKHVLKLQDDYIAIKKNVRVPTPADIIKSNEILAVMVDCKNKLTIDRNMDKRAETLPISEFLRRLKQPQLDWNGKADTLWNEITQKVKKTGDSFLESVRQTPKEQITSDLGNFLCGVIEGDGSLQINLEQPSTRAINSGANPNIFTVEPLFSLTQETKKDLNDFTLYHIIRYVLGDTRETVIFGKPNSDGNADRLYIDNNNNLLKENLIPLLVKYPPITKKSVERFRVFKQVLELPNLKSKNDKLTVISLLEGSDAFQDNLRKLTWNEYRNLI